MYGLAVHTFVILASAWTIAAAASSVVDFFSLFAFASVLFIVWPILGGAWMLWVALTIFARWRSLEWRMLPSFLIAPVVVIATALVVPFVPDPLESAVHRIRASDPEMIDRVFVRYDSGDAWLYVRMRPGTTFRDARSVWCDVVRPARIPAGVGASISSGRRDRIRAWEGTARTVRGVKRDITCPNTPA